MVMAALEEMVVLVEMVVEVELVEYILVGLGTQEIQAILQQDQ